MKKTRKLKLVYFLVVLSSLLISCSNTNDDTSPPTEPGIYRCNSSPVAKGARQFGMDILDVPTVGTYTDSFNNLKTLGGQFQTFHVNWNSIEAAGSGATSGAFTDPYGGLAALNALAISDGIKVTLRIHPVDVPGKFVPSDLMATRFNHTDMQVRFRAMIDFVFTKIAPVNVTRLVVGNEIDGYNPGADTNFWLDYPAFLFDLNTWLDLNYPTVELGFVVTANGSTDNTKVLPSSGGLLAPNVFGDSGWAGVVDFIGFTFYPLDFSFQMKPSSQVTAVFTSMVGLTTKPLHIEEVGYSSATATLGSEDLQSEFFCEVFKNWDTYAGRIESLAILRMVDKTRSDAESVATSYGLTGNENFIEYIRSLGIRDNTNQPKRAYSIIQQELEKRGF